MDEILQLPGTKYDVRYPLDTIFQKFKNSKFKLRRNTSSSACPRSSVLILRCLRTLKIVVKDFDLFSARDAEH